MSETVKQRVRPPVFLPDELSDFARDLILCIRWIGDIPGFETVIIIVELLMISEVYRAFMD